MSDAVNGTIVLAAAAAADANPALQAHGWILLGLIINVFLYGIMVTQTYLYYSTYVNDKLYIKIVVGILFIADTANSVFGVAYLYDALILNFNVPANLDVVTVMFQTDPAMTGIIAGIVQGFFGHRVRVLTKSWILPIIIWICALTTFGAGIGTSIFAGLRPRFSLFITFKEIVAVWLLSAAIGDCIITFALVYSLKNRKTGFKVTDGVINRIIVLTVQTGMITAVAAVVNTATFLWVPTGLHLLFNLPLNKLYTNSMMSSLNARGGWKFTNATQSGVESSQGIVSTGKGDHTRRGGNVVQLQRGPDARTPGGHQGVFVTVEQHELRDRSDGKGPSGEYDDPYNGQPYDGEPLKSTLDMGDRRYNVV